MIYGFIETKSGEIFWWEYTSEHLHYPHWLLYVRIEFIQPNKPIYWHGESRNILNANARVIIPASDVRNIWQEEL